MIALAFLVPLASLVDQLAEDRALTQAERDAQLVAQFVAATSGLTDAGSAFESVTFDGTLAGREVSLLLEDGRLFGAPAEADDDIAAAFAGSTLRVATDGGQAVLVPTVGGNGELAVVRVFVADGELHQGVARSWVLLVLLGVTLIAIGVAVTDRLARSIVSPVEELGDAARRLGSGDFSARVVPSGPDEVSATGSQFNRLASEIGRLIQSERETAADLSHRLRTPLMAARLGVEQIADDRHRIELSHDLDEMERSIDHAIAELRRPSRMLSGEKTILEETVRDRAAFWAPLAEDQRRATTIDIPHSATEVAIPADDLEAAVDALLGNVFAHTPEETAYAVHVAIGRKAEVVFADDGPGLTTDVAALRGSSTAGSTGLGLDIVRKTVEAAGGELTIGSSDSYGAKFTLVFPIS